MKLKELLTVLPFYNTFGTITDQIVNDIKMDHRLVEQGDVFVCIKGFTVDGHTFAEKAVENGATVLIAEKELNVDSALVIIVPDTTRALALLANKYYDYPTEKFPLIGITGTNGKTTITYLLEAILNHHKQKTGLIGTIQMKIGDETFPVKNTTPDALQLQKAFHHMVTEQVDAAIMEVSSHALDMGRVFGCDFDVAIYTNLSQDHLDYHKNMKDYLYAKSLLFSQLGNSYDEKHKKFAIINVDDAHHEVIKRSTGQHIITYGCQNKADIMAQNIKLTISGTSFTLMTPNKTIDINSQLIGKFNVYNMLAAVCAALALNIPLQVIKKALESVTGVNGRFEQVNLGQEFATIVDYAHTPDSLENVLQTIKEFAQGKIFVVVGSGGDRDRSKRPLMAKVALNYADYVIFTSDNPRTEDPQAILDDMIAPLEQSHYDVIENRKKAIHQAIHLANRGDIVLIAGKGHETYQEINGVRYDFDDRIVAKEAIKAKLN